MTTPDDPAEQPYRPPQEASAAQQTDGWPDAPPEPRGGWPAILGLGIVACVGWVLLFAALASIGSGLEMLAMAAPFIAMAALAIAIRFLYRVPLPDGPTIVAQALMFGFVGTIIYVPVCFVAGAGTFAVANSAPGAVVFGFMIISWGGPFLLATAVVALLIRNVVHNKWRRNRALSPEEASGFTDPDRETPIGKDATQPLYRSSK